MLPLDATSPWKHFVSRLIVDLYVYPIRKRGEKFPYSFLFYAMRLSIASQFLELKTCSKLLFRLNNPKVPRSPPRRGRRERSKCSPSLGVGVFLIHGEKRGGQPPIAKQNFGWKQGLFSFLGGKLQPKIMNGSKEPCVKQGKPPTLFDLMNAMRQREEGGDTGGRKHCRRKLNLKDQIVWLHQMKQKLNV